jgi:hypothetical protein
MTKDRDCTIIPALPVTTGSICRGTRATLTPGSGTVCGAQGALLAFRPSSFSS